MKVLISILLSLLLIGCTCNKVRVEYKDKFIYPEQPIIFYPIFDNCKQSLPLTFFSNLDNLMVEDLLRYINELNNINYLCYKAVNDIRVLQDSYIQKNKELNANVNK